MIRVPTPNQPMPDCLDSWCEEGDVFLVLVIPADSLGEDCGPCVALDRDLYGESHLNQDKLSLRLRFSSVVGD